MMNEIEKLLPSLVIDSNYRILANNQTARNMFGEVINKECYRVLYNLDPPCYQHGIKCPVYQKENGFINSIRSGFTDGLTGLYNRKFMLSFLEKARDEFLMVLSNTSLEYGEKVAVRIFKCVDNITALYETKQSGKSRIFVLKADGLNYFINVKKEANYDIHG